MPQTVLWWAAGDEYLGRLAIRHRLTPDLRVEGGNIGYEVRPGARRRGHATAMLAAALPLAAALGIDPAHVDCDADNLASRRVIEKNGGRLRARGARRACTSWCRRGEPAPPAEAPRTSGPVRHVYVHVPFCRARCDYCDFASTPVGDAPDDGVLDLFVRALAAEWELERPAHDVGRLHTLYLGGGTPSLLGPDAARAAARALPAAPHAARRGHRRGQPGGRRAPPSRVAAARRGRARLPRRAEPRRRAVREALGRRAVADPAAAFRRLRAAGVANLTVDLIQGIPGQTPDDVGRDLASVEAARPDHVTWYELDVVAGTPLATRLARLPERERRQPDDGVTYRRVVRALSRAGYDWYEVSNFALAGPPGAPQRGVLARPALPRPRPRRREDRRGVALARRPGRGRLGAGPGARPSGRRARTKPWTEPRASASASCSPRAAAWPCPLAEVARILDLRGRVRPRRGWIGFPAQWYNPGDAKGAIRGQRGVRAPVSRYAFKGE